MPPPNTSSRLDRFLNIPLHHALLLLSALIIISYSNSLYSPFTLDDRHTFIDEPAVYIDKISVATLTELSHSMFGKTRFIPMVTFAANHYLFHLTGSFAQYHLTNIFIHILATIALAFLLKGLLATQVGKQTLKSFPRNHFIFFVCALWALNPVQTNAVTYLVQRMASIVALFYFLTVAFYIHARLSVITKSKIMLYAGALIAACCAFLSKENSATLPLAILLTECMFLSPGRTKELLSKIPPRFWIVLGVTVILLLPLGKSPWQSILSGYDIRNFTLVERLLTEARVVVFYMSLLILPLPSRLNLDHDFPISTSVFSPPTTIMAILFLIALLAAAIKFRSKYPLFSFGIFWFFLNLLVESTFVPLEIIFEHRLYLPAAGFFIAILGIVDTSLQHVPRQPRNDITYHITVLLLTICLCTSSVLTTLRNNDWRDINSLQKDSYNKSPHKSRVITNYGQFLGSNGKIDQSIEILEKCIKNGQHGNEDYVNATNNILVAYIEKEKVKEGIDVVSKHIKNMPPDCNTIALPVLFYNLAVALKETERYSDALESQLTSMRTMLDISGGNANIRSVKNLEYFAALAYKNEKTRQELQLDEFGQDNKIAVPLYMAKMLLDLRLYKFANDYLKYVELSSRENMIYTGLMEKLNKEQLKNKTISLQSDFNKHLALMDSTLYSFCMNTARFIMTDYSPLLFLTDRLLNKAEAIAPGDPFVALYKVRWLMQMHKFDEAVIQITESMKQHPDFVPLLEFGGDIFLQIKDNDRAAKIFKHILAIYPGVAKWQKYQKIIGQVAKEKEGLLQ